MPADVVERALARQSEAGGTLDTALLEAGALPEDVLAGLLSRAAELPAAPPGAWSGDDARARRVFPSRVAERHGLAPFALEGRELSLVATHPVDLGLLDEISFMLSLHLTAHVGPEWRVRELIHRLYGAPLSPRLAALALAAGAPAAAAPIAQDEEAPPAEEGGQAPSSGAAGFGRDESEPLEPLAAALALALDSVEASSPRDDPREDAPDAGTEEEEPPAPQPLAAAPDRTAPPRWTLDDARAALAAARDRDEVVLVALRYARDFFDFAAMFAVTRDAVAGHDALGPDDARERCRSVAIWVSDPGTFKTVIETRSPHLGPFGRDTPGNETILSALRREAPRTSLVYPVLVRDRPVCVLYAENGEAPVSPRRLGDLLLFLAGVGGAFEQIIRERKERRPRRPRRREGAPAPLPTSAGHEPRSAERAGEDARPDGDRGLPERPPRIFPPEPPALELAPAPSGGGAAAPASPPAGAAPAAVSPAPAAAESLDGLEEQLFSITLDVSDLDAPPEPSPAPAPASTPEAIAAAPHAGAKTLRLPAPVPAAPPSTEAAPPAPEPPSAPAEPVRERPPPATLADQALDADPGAAAAACQALAGCRRHPALRPAVEKLRRALLSGMSARAVRGARAIAALRDVESIPLLIQVLETSEPEAARAAADALSAITLQRLGVDARGWLGWWKENRGRGRAEWLFSGLTSPERETRVAASVELSLAAPPPVAYSADLPAAERERVAREWAGWWSRSGHVL